MSVAQKFVEGKLGKMTERVSGFHYAVYTISDESGRFSEDSFTDMDHAYEVMARKLEPGR